jgi:Tol biopolymer transport system component
MPDFDPLRPQATREPNRLNRLRTVLMANWRAAWIGVGIFFFVLVVVPGGLLIYQSSGIGGQQNGKILFLRDGGIYEMNADGTGVTNVMDASFDVGYPGMSPNGEKIVFQTHFQTNQDGHDLYDLYVANADGSGEPTRLINNLYQGWQVAPVLSPDGNRIAFSAQSGYNGLSRFSRGSGDDIYTIDVDGADLTRLTKMKGSELDLLWSRDGTKIFFRNLHYITTGETMDSGGNVVDVQEEISQNLQMNADGTRITHVSNSLVSNSLASLSELAWSPYCKEIAYWRDPDGDTYGNIYVRNADGQEVQITHNMDISPGTYLVLSPDCTKIAFSSYVGIHVMNADGSGEPTRLTKGQSDSVIGWRSK